jgi:hypothetical protein
MQKELEDKLRMVGVNRRKGDRRGARWMNPNTQHTQAKAA